MSRYLVDRITGRRNVGVSTQTTVTSVEGRDAMLEAIQWRRGSSGEDVRRPIHHLFLFIGAEPNTSLIVAACRCAVTRRQGEEPGATPARAGDGAGDGGEARINRALPVEAIGRDGD